jgi:hypothetical protein
MEGRSSIDEIMDRMGKKMNPPKWNIKAFPLLTVTLLFLLWEKFHFGPSSWPVGTGRKYMKWLRR